jgi:phosphopantothenoylcysteine decarboxylase/phosphopantothenate--cysteine ligase
MLAAVQASLPADIFIGTAAVADWRVENAGTQKMKKSPAGGPVLQFAENPDILAHVAGLAAQRPKLVVGFAAETQNVIAYAQDKLARKKCDLIVANDVSPESGVMGGSKNEVHLVSKSGVESWPLLDKEEVARRLVATLTDLLNKGGAA